MALNSTNKLYLQEFNLEPIMKKLLFGISAMLMTGACFGQSTLYHGMYDNNTIDVIDTAGGAYTVTSTLTVTNDIASPIYGVYGLSLHPDTDEMYVLYRDNDENNGRLGIIDLTDGSIIDIGNCGNMTDICFYGSTLYGNLGDPSGYGMVEINLTDASTVPVLSAPEFGYGHSLAWDYDNDLIVRLNDDDNNYFIVDPSDWSYTEYIPSSWLNANNYTNGAVFKNDSILIVSGGGNILEMNMNDESWVEVTTLPCFDE